MRYIVFIVFLLFGCKSAERIAKEKAAKSENERQKEQTQLQKMRQEYPCVPVEPLIKGVTVYIPGEKIPCPDNGTGKRDSIQCPPNEYRVDTAKILDMAHLKQYEDSLASERYYYSLTRDQLTISNKKIEVQNGKIEILTEGIKKRNKTIIWMGMIILGLTGWTFRKVILALFGKLV